MADEDGISDSNEEVGPLPEPKPSDDRSPHFEHISYIPHAVAEANKAREALARLPPGARLFLGVFAGFHAPVTKAVAVLGLDHFQPFDLDADSAFDILHDPTYELMLQVCWSGIVGSALRLPGGPPALRPEHLDGLPDLSPQGKAIHGRGKDFFEAGLQRRHSHR